MMEDSKRYEQENLSLCESVFALFDMAHRYSDRSRRDLADEIFMINNLFEDKIIESLMIYVDEGLLMTMIRRKR